MPFTFSHPAIVLPLSYLPQKWFSLTGLIIGSLAPDFEYFIRMKIQSDFSHTISGLFWFDLPLGVLIAFIFHNIIRDSLFNNLPKILRSRVLNFKNFDWNNYFINNWIIVIISILIGSVSHLLWDSFTHDNGYFVKMIPFLASNMGFFGIEIPMLKFLQHLSTLIGGVVIIFSLFKITPSKAEPKPINYKYWVILIVLTLVIISIRLVCGLNYKLYGNVIVTAISAGLISFVLTSLIIRENSNCL